MRHHVARLALATAIIKGDSMLNRTPAMLGTLCVAVLVGCANAPPAATSSTAPKTDRYAKALSFPDRLRPNADASGAMSWTDAGIDFRQYDRILVERIRVDLDSESSSVDPNDLKALVDYFHQAIVKALDPPYRLVDQSAPRVLRIRITLVDLVSTKPAMSVVVLLTPFATLPDLASGPATGRPAGSAPYLGRSAIAVEFIDGETNAVIAEYAETRFGRKYVVDTSKGGNQAMAGLATNYLDSYSTWAYAKQAFDQWAVQFRTRLDQINAH